MNNPDILMPSNDHTSMPDDEFKWKDRNIETKAQATKFYQTELNSGLVWVFKGATGSPDNEDYFDYDMWIPHFDKEPLKRTYNLNDGLIIRHTHSLPGTPDHIKYKSVHANEGTLEIEIDVEKGHVVGCFSAKFKTNYDLEPKGSFEMTEWRPVKE
ncbi:hypothetical protein [Pseudomonas sp. BF-R-01]|uniref:hypothetical protein n=1 Tax=Pseudomonas sp. BF-R-01 TaxID=2832365 RepID=UPI000FA02B56|nr:hypothetical protein [Pseudomonas sp. BF-R-01]